MTETADLGGLRMLTVQDAAQRILTALRRRRAFIAFPGRDLWQVRLLRYLPRSAADWLAHRLLLRSKRK